MATKVPTDPNMTPEVRRFLEALNSQLESAESAAAGLTQTEYLSGAIKIPANQEYRVIESIPYGATLTVFTGKTAAGTLTATLEIQNVAVTTGVLSATTSQSAVAPTALNVMSVGGTLSIRVSAVSSATDFSWTVKYTRTLVH